MKEGKIMTLFRKIITLTLITLMAISGTGWAKVTDLPELEGWAGGPLFSQPLTAPSGNYGIWLKRSYVAQNRRNFDVILLSGTGSGDLYLPDTQIDTNDRPIGFGATYRTLSVEKYEALLEWYPHIGGALSVRLPEQTTLIVESKCLSEDELIAIMKKIITEVEKTL